MKIDDRKHNIYNVAWPGKSHFFRDFTTTENKNFLLNIYKNRKNIKFQLIMTDYSLTFVHIAKNLSGGHLKYTLSIGYKLAS